MPPKTVSFYTLGCRVNQYETRRWMARIPPEVTIVPYGDPADVIVINSCLVTSQAERDTRQAVHRARRANPGATIVTTGCYVDLHDDTTSLEPGLVVVERERKEDIPSIVAQLLGVTPSMRMVLPGFAPSASRPPLLIQTGCDKRCAYCIIPHARGASWSRPSTEILAELATMSKQYGEVVLTGINLGSWTEEGRGFGWLLGRLLDELPAGTRIRMGSVEPEYVTDEVISHLAHPRLAPHIHLPLQATSDPVLRAMGRPNTTSQYEMLCHRILKVNPAMAIGADVIAGFPSETHEDHLAGARWLAGLPLSYLHVFPFSPRPGTRAARLEGLPKATVKARAADLRAEDARLRARFLAALQDTEVEVATERPLPETGWYQGMSGSFITVDFRSSAPPPPLVRVRVDTVDSGAIQGEALDAPLPHG